MTDNLPNDRQAFTNSLWKQPAALGPGFSLAELLITLAIIGFLMAFTVPALLQSQNAAANSKYSAIARDTEFMVFNAYEQYRRRNSSVSSNMQVSSLTPYMNYVSIDTSTSSLINGPPAGQGYYGSQNCGAQFVGNYICYRLHNGAVLWFWDLYYFGGTNTTNAIWFNIDPDGSGPTEALQTFLTYDGRIYTVKNLPTTMTMGYLFSTVTQAPASSDATWFTGN